MQTTALLKKEAPKGAVPAFGKFTNPLQRKTIGEEEDALQLKQNPLQLQTGLDEEEEPLQMKQAPVQLMDGLDDEEEEPLQMKQNPLQRMEENDEDLLQKKGNPLQLKKESQNLLQLKQTTGTTLQLQEQETATPQPNKNDTGLPDNLKVGVEALSGYSMDDVKVHYNSDKPAQLQALAYAQGTDIHVAPGQEKHLPHEAWHVVQQKQGRVYPTVQMKQGVAVNNDKGLENEADIMGGKAISSSIQSDSSNYAETRDAKFVNVQSESSAKMQLQKLNSSTAQLQQIIYKKANKVSNSSINVIQQTPADWQGAPQIARIVNHPHGWFGVWKKIKIKINEYKAILPGPGELDARRSKLDEIRPLINIWEADPKHTAASTEQRIIDIRADMPVLKNLINREYLQVATATDLITGGHSETRHGADLTDEQLQDRLTTGLDRSGAPAPADFSSRFASHDLLVRTRNDAVNQLNTARTATIAQLGPHISNFFYRWEAFENTPAGPAKGVAAQARNAARQAVQNSANTIPTPSINLLQVAIQNPPMGGVISTSQIAARVQNMVQIRQRYRIVINHGQNLGPSFQGTGPLGGPHPGAIPALAAPQSTLTVVDPGVQALLTTPVAANWPLTTHYPTQAPPPPFGIS